MRCALTEPGGADDHTTTEITFGEVTVDAQCACRCAPPGKLPLERKPNHSKRGGMLVEAVGAQEVSMTTLFSTPPSSGRRNRGVLRTLLRCLVAIVFIAVMATVVGCPHLFAFMPADADQALSAVDHISVGQDTVATTIEALQLRGGPRRHDGNRWFGSSDPLRRCRFRRPSGVD